MMTTFLNVILAIAIVEGRSHILSLENREPPADIALPVFHVIDCPEGGKAEYCLHVEGIGMIGVEAVSETVFEGSLTGDAIDEPISVVIIHNPEDSSALINFHHPDIPCAEFDVDLETFTVHCIQGGYNTEDDDDELEELKNRGITAANTKGPIVPLGTDNPNGIDVKVLFTFDKEFRSAFGDEGMTQVIALVKNAYKDSSLVSKIGTAVNIIGEAATYSGAFTRTDFDSRSSSVMGQKARAQGAKYDLFTFITHPGAGGVAYGGQACNSADPTLRISFNKAYGAWQCGYYRPPNPIDCSKPANRIALTAETIAHELGHSLGMAHDFKSKGPYVYRKYESEQKDCRGLMDYIDDGVGWSACSARDFSRYITNGGSSKSCLRKGTCTDTSNGAGDPWGDGCDVYARFKYWCGKYNDDDFKSEKMCCACGGGNFVAAGGK